MGKGKKRKNPGVGVDFRKVKHKVGKKLPKAQNDTRTDFQARSINLPSQSITQDKAGAAVSERNLTLKELVAQLSHHNSSTRRDALTGLQQLLAAHPAEARRHTATLLEALAPRLSDGEGPVRAALLTTLRAAVLPALGPSALSPFMPLLMAHVSAALTNLSSDVRCDALSVLEAVTESAPQLMAQQQQLSAALAHYAGLLSRANRGKSVKSQALTGLVKVVGSLDRFLQLALGGTSTSGAAGTAGAAAAAAGGDGDAAGFAFGSGNGSSGEQCALLLQAQRAAAAPAAASQVPSGAWLLQLYCSGFSAGNTGTKPKQQQGRSGSSSGSQHNKQQQQPSEQSAGADGDGSSGSGSGSGKQLQQQVLALLEVLFDCWSEAAPGSLSTAPELESAQVLVHILNATHLIMRHFSPAGSNNSSSSSGSSNHPDAPPTSALIAAAAAGGVQEVLCPGFNTRRDQLQWLQQAAGLVLPKLVKAFPVAPPATRGLSVALYDLLQRFNMLGMQLCSGFMAAGVAWPAQQQQQQRQHERSQQQQQQHAVGADGGGMAVGVVLQEWQQRLLDFMTGVLAAGNCLPQLEPAAPAAAGPGPRNTPPGGSNSQQQQQQQNEAAAAAAAPANSSLNSSTVLVAVLHSLQQLLPQLLGQPRQHVLAAVGQLAAAAAPATDASAAAGGDASFSVRPLSAAAAGAAGSNSVRIACLRLQLQLMTQHLWRGLPDPLEEGHIAAWLAAAPKQLYQLGASKPKISQLLLQLLFEAARLAVPGLPMEQQLQALQPQLAALLCTALPAPPGGGTTAPGSAAGKQSGKKQQQQAGGVAVTASASAAAAAPVKVLLGPLPDLPPSCQHLAFDTLAHLPQLTPPLLKAVALSCRLTPYSDAAVQRLLDGLLSSAAGSMPPHVYVSFVATLLSPGPPGGYTHRHQGSSKGAGSNSNSGRRGLQAGFVRHQQVVDAVARWLHCYGPLPQLLQLMAAPLLQQYEGLQGEQQQGGAEGGSAAAVCCLSYSLLAVAALAAGCWLPSSSGSQCVAGPAAEEQEAAARAIPAQLLSILPAVLASHCLSRATGAADAFAAEAAVEACLQQLVLPLAHTLPASSLLLPLLQQLVDVAVQEGQQSEEGVLRAVLHVMRVLLAQQGLKLVWLQHGSEVQEGLLQRLEGVARRAQERSGDGSALAQVQQLQTAVSMLLG